MAASWSRRSWRWLRWSFAAVVLCALVTAAAPISRAQDLASAFRDLATGADFRLRVAAALTIGKSKHPEARGALEKALADPHPAVRAASAAGLGALGDPAAVPALRAAAEKESTSSVRAQIETTVTRLSRGSSTGKPRFLIAIGRMDNRAGAAAASLTPTLKSTTRSRAQQVPGVELLADGADPAAESKSRNLPVFFLDGSLVQLSKVERSPDVSYSARVEYLVRKLPEQSLKGTIAGRAEAIADARSVRSANEHTRLQLDAVNAAVDSAFKGAPPVLEAAAGR